jgi:transposase-like protein
MRIAVIVTFTRTRRQRWSFCVFARSEIVDDSYKRHRFPPERIAHTAWLHVRFDLSLREVEETLRERGVSVPYGTFKR